METVGNTEANTDMWILIVRHESSHQDDNVLDLCHNKSY